MSQAAPLPASRTLSEALAIWMIAGLAIVASWGTYRQFAPFVTLGTIPIYGLLALAPFGLVAFAGKTGLRPFDFLPLVLALLALMSFSWSLVPHSWGLTAFYYVACAGLYLCCRLFVRSPNAVKLITISAGAGALLGSTMIEPIQTQWMTAESRSAIAGLNQNFTAYVFAGTMYLLLIYARHLTQNILFKAAAWLVCAVLAYNIVALGTRGAMIAVGLMFAWEVTSRFLGTRLAGPITITAAVLAVAFSFGVFEWVGAVVEAMFQRDSGNLSGRSHIWEYARSEIWRHPILGIGAGSFQFVNPLQLAGHNYFLTAWLDLGFLGFAATLTFFGAGLSPAISLESAMFRNVVGLFACYFLPIATTGNIELSPFAWVVTALTFSLLRSTPSAAQSKRQSMQAAFPPPSAVRPFMVHRSPQIPRGPTPPNSR